MRVVHLQHFVKEDFDLSASREMLGGEEVAEGIGTEARGRESLRGAREERVDA